jgi:hypothetical protein
MCMKVVKSPYLYEKLIPYIFFTYRPKDSSRVKTVYALNSTNIV